MVDPEIIFLFETKESDFEWELHFVARYKKRETGPHIKGYITEQEYFESLKHNCLQEVLEQQRKAMFLKLKKESEKEIPSLR